MPQTLREYVLAHTEKLFPRSKPERRDALRNDICDYAEWLSTPSNRKGEQPQVSGKAIARKLYSKFLSEPSEDHARFYPVRHNDPKRAYKG